MKTNLLSTVPKFNNDDWSSASELREYMSASNPEMPRIEVKSFDSSLHLTGKTRIIPLDLSSDLKTAYPATTPNLMANFLRLCAGESLQTDTNATSEMFYVIRGSGTSETEWGVTRWSEGDLFVIPATAKVSHSANSDSALYWVNDSPILNYLGVTPNKQQFAPLLFTHAQITSRLAQERNAPDALTRNRVGLLLGNPACPLTKTLSHTLWSLYNILPAGATQLPHRHNSVAIDFCVTAGDNTYTLIGEKIDEKGHIINPIKAMWTPGSLFTTPPGWWHSHHNESAEDAIVLPIQDAGVLTYMQILDIQFIKSSS